jgi:DNA-binding response OmpR family regulator
MDMQMPELDGLAATRALRGTGYDPPIIAMTANAMKAELDACLDAGMNDHITKPIDRKALLQTLRRWLPERLKTPADVDRGDARRESAPSPVRVVPVLADTPTLHDIDVAGSLARLGLDFETFQRMLIRFVDGQGTGARA